MTDHTALAKELRERAPPSDNALFGYCGDLMRRAATALERQTVGEGEREELIVEGLLNAAFSVLHHDVSEDSPAGIYERETLHKKFAALLRAPEVPVVTDGAYITWGWAEEKDGKIELFVTPSAAREATERGAKLVTLFQRILTGSRDNG